jgi:hypothetical protein
MVKMTKTEPALKLYVWADPYNVSYGSSMVFAVAENLAAARKQAAKGKFYSFGLFEKSHDMSHVVLGKPSRVHKLPCAEWFEWSE